MKLSDLAPGDVAVFLDSRDEQEGVPFVVTGIKDGRRLTQRPSEPWPLSLPNFQRRSVRRLGRGRLVPARIVMGGEPDAELTWTDAKPTVPGWYWWRRIDEKYDERTVFVDVVDGELKMRIRSFWQEPFGQFAGPIPVPAERGEGQE